MIVWLILCDMEKGWFVCWRWYTVPEITGKLFGFLETQLW